MRFLRRRILSVLMLGCIGLLFIGLLAMAMRMPHTPGYEHVTFIPKSGFPEAEDKELVLTFENPYSSSHAFSECVIFTLSQGNGAYLRASKETLLPSMFFLLVCFFGIFLFPMISFIFGQINYRYLEIRTIILRSTF